MPENKVTFGLKNVHIAFETEESTDAVPVWGPFVPIPGAVRYTPTPVGESGTFYADDTAYYVYSANNGYTSELEVANVPTDMKAEMYGWDIDTNGALVENANGKPKKFAMAAEFDGDAHATRFILYRSQVTGRPGKEQTTKTESITPNTDVVALSHTPIPVGSRMVPRLDMPAGSVAYDNFYKNVYLPTFGTAPTTPSGGAA